MVILLKNIGSPNQILVLVHDLDVKEAVQECVGGAELHKRKQQIQVFSDQTSSQLKKHVYANYMQFIETAKEISRNYPSNSLRFSIFLHNSANLYVRCHRFGVRNVSIVPFTHRTK